VRRRPPTTPQRDAYDVAVRYLAPRPRSVGEIRRQLRAKRFDDEAIDRAIDQLRAQGHIDDEAFARYWLEQRARFRPKGERALVAELLQKGVSRETIDVVLGERAPEVDAGQALAALRSVVGRWGELSEVERRRKAQAYLLRRGFSYDAIEEALAALAEG
jgi:regulatory protein